GHLRESCDAGRVDRDEVGEGTADIDADAVHRLAARPSPSPAMRERVPERAARRRVRGFGQRHPHPPTPAAWAPPSPAVRERGLSASSAMLFTNPFAASSAIAAGSRSAGLPQPPPPPDSRMRRSPGRITRPVSLVLIARGGWLP